MDAGTDDAATPAELEFIARIQRDRARGRTLRRRAMLAGTTAVVVSAALLTTQGVWLVRPSQTVVATAVPPMPSPAVAAIPVSRPPEKPADTPRSVVDPAQPPPRHVKPATTIAPQRRVVRPATAIRGVTGVARVNRAAATVSRPSAAPRFARDGGSPVSSRSQTEAP